MVRVESPPGPPVWFPWLLGDVTGGLPVPGVDGVLVVTGELVGLLPGGEADPGGRQGLSEGHTDTEGLGGLPGRPVGPVNPGGLEGLPAGGEGLEGDPVGLVYPGGLEGQPAGGEGLEGSHVGLVNPGGLDGG